MKTPRYFVSLGGVNLHCITSFELSADRDIDAYDGIGSGKFNVPGSKNPRQWTIDCELKQNGSELSGMNTWSASELFKQFETWRGKVDTPIRMVKTDSIYPAANISCLVWLKSYKPKESDEQGVYDTEIVVEEYIPVGVKTTSIPYISRPGKVPIPPKVTITKKNTVYRNYRKTGIGTKADAATKTINGRNKNHDDSSALKDPKTGKYLTNAAAVKSGSAWNVGTKTDSHITGSTDYSHSTDTGLLLKRAAAKTGRFDANGFDTWTKNVQTAFNSISTGIGIAAKLYFHL